MKILKQFNSVADLGKWHLFLIKSVYGIVTKKCNNMPGGEGRGEATHTLVCLAVTDICHLNPPWIYKPSSLKNTVNIAPNM